MTYPSTLTRTLITAVVGPMLLVIMPLTGALVGAVGGGWAAVDSLTATPKPKPEAEQPRKCGMYGFVDLVFGLIVLVVAVVIGLAFGAILGLAVAFVCVMPFVGWAVYGTLDEADE